MLKLHHEQTLYTILPPLHLIFRSIELCPVHSTKVVILGQDPYHSPNIANGLAFSVNPSIITLPPSLLNIFKELKDDIGYISDDISNGDLSPWANKGVLLLNTILTVRQGKPFSHSKIIGWENYTNDIIKQVNSLNNNVVFLLWGNHAKSKSYLINTSKHHILLASHPSPLSAHRGFFGCKHFSKTNHILNEKIF